MTIQINWAISNLDRRTADGFITTAHWRCTAIDGEFSASVYSTCSWSEGVPVIPYEDVTQEDVLNWCWTNGVDKDVTEANVAAQIEAQKNPVSATGVPWAV